jgi:hypothetical protein
MHGWFAPVTHIHMMPQVTARCHGKVGRAGAAMHSLNWSGWSWQHPLHMPKQCVHAQSKALMIVFQIWVCM